MASLWGLRRVHRTVKVHSGFWHAWAHAPPAGPRQPSQQAAPEFVAEAQQGQQVASECTAEAQQGQQAGMEDPPGPPGPLMGAAAGCTAGAANGIGQQAPGRAQTREAGATHGLPGQEQQEQERRAGWFEPLEEVLSLSPSPSLPEGGEAATLCSEEAGEAAPYCDQLLRRLEGILQEQGLDPASVDFYLTGESMGWSWTFTYRLVVG